MNESGKSDISPGESDASPSLQKQLAYWRGDTLWHDYPFRGLFSIKTGKRMPAKLIYPSRVVGGRMDLVWAFLNKKGKYNGEFLPTDAQILRKHGYVEKEELVKAGVRLNSNKTNIEIYRIDDGCPEEVISDLKNQDSDVKYKKSL